MTTPTNVLQILVQSGLLDEAAVERVRVYAREHQTDLGQAVLALGLATEDDLGAATAQLFHLPYVHHDQVKVEPEALLKLPRGQILKYGVFPVSARGSILTVVVCNPLAVLRLEQEVQSRGLGLRTMVVSQKTLAKLFETHLKQLPYANMQDAFRSQFVSGFEGVTRLLDVFTDDNAVVTQVDQILGGGGRMKASDIHVGHGDGILKVRYRIDGSLIAKDVRMNRDHQDAVIRRLKILAQVDLLEKQRPQDGGFTHQLGKGPSARQVFFRAAFLPCEEGEKVCLRLAGSGAALRPLEEIGLGSRNLELVRRVLDRPSGLVLITGPAGSGKTSTAHACLREVFRPELTIYTIEDPVEIRVPDYVQTCVNESAGLTFEVLLRSLLRQDPNVIFVGEIRDRETARIAAEAALTGNLILSTLHTNDACSTPARFLELGVEPYVAGTAARGIVSQRLVRRLCTCRQPTSTLPDGVRALKERFGLVGDSLYEPTGCGDCKQTGFRGRAVVAEVLLLEGGVSDLVMNRASATEVRAEALRRGFRPLVVEGCEKALAGVTTLAEVRRVTGSVI